MELSPKKPGPADVRNARWQTVSTLMQEGGLQVKDIIARLPAGADKDKWRSFLSNFRSGVSSLTPERAAILGPALGVQPMSLLTDCSEKERTKLNAILSGQTNGEPPVEAPQNATGAIPEETLLKEIQSALEKLMTERGLSSRMIAGMVEDDEFTRDTVAMQIADARQGEAALTKDLCVRIANALTMDLSVLYPTSTATIPLTPAAGVEQTPRVAETLPERPIKRRTKKIPTETGQPAPQETGVTQEALIELSIEDLQRYFGGRSFKILRLPDGKHIIRADRTVSKDELIEMLLSLHRK